jgi:hypothetical protein
MKRRIERMEQLVAVEREYRVVAVAVGVLGDRLRADPSGLKAHGLEQADYRQAVGRLEATYLIRLFAEFEAGLREAWVRKYRQKTHPPMAQLLAAITARCAIARRWHEAVDEVRRCRNALVHEEDAAVTPVSVADAGARLKWYFSRLPAHW